MKLPKVVSVAVITAVAFAAGLFVFHPVKIAVTDVDIKDKEFDTLTTQTDNQCKHPIYFQLSITTVSINSDCCFCFHSL